MATKTLGTLSVDLLANTGAFVRGMTAAERQSDKTAKAIKRRQQKLAKELDDIYKGVGAAIGAAFGAIAVSVHSSIDSMWKLATVAQQIAMPVDQFSALAAVANDAEIGMDSLSTGLRTMARNLALAQQGSAQASAAFKSIGLDPAKLKDSKTAFLAIADALSKYRDDVNKTAIEQQIFGRSGAELNALLNEGSASIGQLMDQQREMGNTVTPQAAEALGKYDDAMDLLSDSVNGLRNRLAVALLPALTSVNVELGKFATSQDAKDFANGLSTVLVTLGRAAMVVVAAFDEIGKSIGGAMAIAQQATQGMTLLDAVSPIAMTVRMAKNAAAVKTTAKEVTADIAADVKMWMDQIANFGAEATASAAKQIRASGPAAPSIHLAPTGGAKAKATPRDTADRDHLRTNDELIQQMHKLDGLYQSNIASINGVTSAEQAFNERMAGANQLIEAGRINWEQYSNIANDALDQLNGKAQPVFDQLSVAAQAAAHDMTDAFNSVVSSFSDGIVNMLNGGSLGFKNILREFLKMVEKMIVQWLILKAIMGIGGALGGTADGTNFASFLFRGGAPAGRAIGGPVGAGTTYLVGERGPELFTPSSSGRITPNNQLGGLSGGGNITVYSGDVNVTNTDDSKDDGNDASAARQLAKMIEAQTKQVIVRAMQPGGLLWKQRNGVPA